MANPTQAARQPHGAIHIDTIQDTILPDALSGNGIVGGTGTAADPYRIEGWDITVDQGSAIHLERLDAHFLIRNVRLQAPIVLVADSIAGLTVHDSYLQGGVFRTNEVRVVQIKTIQGADLARWRVDGSNVPGTHLKMDDVALSFHGETGRSDEAAFVCSSCLGSVIENLSLDTTSSAYGFALFLGGSSDSPERLHNLSIFARGGGLSLLKPAQVIGADLRSSGAVRDSTGILAREALVRHAVVAGFDRGVHAFVGDLTLESSKIIGSGHEGLALYTAGDVRIEDAVFQGNYCAIAAPTAPESDRTIEEPIWGGPSSASLTGFRSLVVRNSSFHENRGCSIYLDIIGLEADARWNWWGGDDPGVSWKPGCGCVTQGVSFDPILRESPHDVLRSPRQSPVAGLVACLLIVISTAGHLQRTTRR